MISDKDHVFGDLILRHEKTSESNPLDRISVRDYILDVEIGAFQAERGVTQRIKINVVLEVSLHEAAQQDDVDQVLSYDAIIEAINAQISAERFNLLETFAERVAERILVNQKAVRAYVRVEKLDRIPGALGVEIVRGRQQEPEEKAQMGSADITPMVAFLPNSVLNGPDLTAWLDALIAQPSPVIICLPQIQDTLPQAKTSASDFRISLLSIEQNAWILVAKDDRCNVVSSRTELDWGLKNNQLSIWAPSKLILDTVNGPKGGDVNSIHMARWLSRELGAANLTVLGPGGQNEDVNINRPEQV